jgi:hypothetical protein
VSFGGGFGLEMAGLDERGPNWRVLFCENMIVIQGRIIFGRGFLSAQRPDSCFSDAFRCKDIGLTIGGVGRNKCWMRTVVYLVNRDIRSGAFTSSAHGRRGAYIERRIGMTSRCVEAMLAGAGRGQRGAPVLRWRRHTDSHSIHNFPTFRLTDNSLSGSSLSYELR